MKSNSKSASPTQSLPRLEKFLLYWAGASPSILGQAECATERKKYTALGLTVLFTAGLASLSGGYAFFTVFRTVAPSALFGAFWGLGIVGNLDRIFVMNLRKKQRQGWKRIFGASDLLVTATPRLILAFFLALTVSKPLEIQIFRWEIEAEISSQAMQRLQEKEKELLQSPKLLALQAETASIERKQKENKAKLDLARERYNCEVSGNVSQRCQDLGTSGKAGKGSIAEELRLILEQVKTETQTEAQKLDRDLAKNQAAIEAENSKNRQLLDAFKAKQQQADGLLARLEVLESLGQKNPHIFLINACVTAVFVLIEIAPLLAKILSQYGPYDAALEYKETTSIHYYQKSSELKLKAIDSKLTQQFQTSEDIEKIKLDNKKEIFIAVHNAMKEILLQHFEQLIQDLLQTELSGLKQLREQAVRHLETLIADLLSRYSREFEALKREMEERLHRFEEEMLQETFSTQKWAAQEESLWEQLEREINEFKSTVEEYQKNFKEEE